MRCAGMLSWNSKIPDRRVPAAAALPVRRRLCSRIAKQHHYNRDGKQSPDCASYLACDEHDTDGLVLHGTRCWSVMIDVLRALLMSSGESTLVFLFILHRATDLLALCCVNLSQRLLCVCQKDFASVNQKQMDKHMAT